MTERVFEGHGIEVLKRGSQFFIRYDAGEIVVEMKEIEVSEKEAEKAQEGERQAYEVILRAQQHAL